MSNIRISKIAAIALFLFSPLAVLNSKAKQICSESEFSAIEYTGSSDDSRGSISFMSFNIRFDRPTHPVPTPYNEWANRKEQVVSLIRFYTPDFLGLQEDQVHQLEYIDKNLKGYDWIGAGGKNDGKKSGEFCSIHYNSERFELLKGTDQTIWMSETPDIPSSSWDGASPRILNYGKFKDKRSGVEFYVFNTHFDHAGQKAREESAKLIRKKIEEVSRGKPCIVMGDFNATEENLVYEILTKGGSPLLDAFYNSENPHIGPLFTREGFAVRSDSKKYRLDYIFVSEEIKVLKHAFIASNRNGYYLSDHLPVIAEILP